MTKTSEASQLIQKIPGVIATCKERIAQTEEQLSRLRTVYNGETANQMYREKLTAATDQNRADLESLKQEITSEIERARGEVQKRLQPLLSSAKPEHVEAGRYGESLAYRMASSMSPERLEEEYDKAMKSNQTDLASNLIHWRTLMTDPSDFEKMHLLEQLNNTHISALGLDVYIESANQLEALLPFIDRWSEALSTGKNPFAERNITEQVTLGRIDSQIVAGLYGG